MFPMGSNFSICLYFIDSGNTVTTAIDVLIDSGVEEENVIILTLFATYTGKY